VYIAILFYNRASLTVFAVAIFLALVILSVLSPFSSITKIVLWIIAFIIFIPLLIIQLRQKLLSYHLLKYFRQVMPKMSKTEKQAIAAGTVVWEGELFGGMPDWKKFLQRPAAKLSAEEQAFLSGPVETLCQMIDDWDITHNRADMPPEMWQFIKEEGFFGMIIPKQYGGKEFSATAHSEVIMKVGSCSISVASTIAVPNSLGPAELLLHYGTTEQKDYYLPRLAKSEEIPCFALTGPEAGSDASAIPDSGIVCRSLYEGKETLCIRLNFNKRYITLAPIATVIGLAFKLYDPEHLLGAKEDIGITCALIPRTTPGITIGRRHFPLNMAFLNGPIQGKDVLIPVDYIIGGIKMAGQGWRMLVECLSVGRGITLPSMATGGTKVAALSSGAYSRIRKQFSVSIGKFEGIEEVLARIAGNAYILDAIRHFTVAAIDNGEKPAVLTAISKYHTTTRSRAAAADAMDIHGGKGICLGPRNYLGRGYQGIPISITVEGANILTRSLIIFGQGAIRCHPYILAEINAATEKDEPQALIKFDKAIFAHMGFMLSNVFRSLLLGLTAGYIAQAPGGEARRYYQQLSRYSSSFALLADVSFATIGGDLKRKEKISARLGDILSMMILCSSVLKRFHEQGEPTEDRGLVHYTCQELLYGIQQQIDGVLKNFPNRCVATLLQILIFPIGHCLNPPKDELSHRLASSLITPNDMRTRLCAGIYLGTTGVNPIGRMEKILEKMIAAEPIEMKIENAKRKHEIRGHNFVELIDAAIAAKIISEEEGRQMHEAHAACMEVIAVDDFDIKDLIRVTDK
jgi:acyl-CoA dehydrogenase